MALTLREAITADQARVFVNGDDEVTPGDICQVGTEFLAVSGIGDGVVHSEPVGYQVLSVRRGAIGSARSAHAAGSTVTRVQLVVQTDAPTAPPSAQGGGGGVQLVSLLGPFRINFDTTNVTQEMVLADLLAGTVVVHGWCVVRETWAVDGGGQMHLQLCIGPLVDNVQFRNVQIDSSWATTYPESGVDPGSDPTDAVAYNVPGVVGSTDTVLTAHVSANSTDLTAGAMDVYVLIASPAA